MFPITSVGMLVSLSVFGATIGGRIQTIALLFFALVASFAGFFAAFKGPHQTFLLNIIRGWLATLYAAGYLYLLIVRPDRGEWSELMSGLGYVTWPVVWVYPSLYTYWHRRNVEHLPPPPPRRIRLPYRGRDAE